MSYCKVLDIFVPILTKFGLSQQTFKVPNIKFHENPSGGIDMAKLIVGFRYLRE